MEAQLIADARSTRAFLLEGSKRKGKAAPIRTSFLQIRQPDDTTTPGPLATLVRHHDELALDLYLLLIALASAPPYDVTRDARYWARALGKTYKNGEHNVQSISKAWARLEKAGLITRERRGNYAKVTPRHESGDAEAPQYAPPTGADGDLYFKIPFDYWLAEDPLHDRLGLGEKALLLICLSRLRPSFTMTATTVQRWYGIGTDTAQKGLKGLADKGVLEVTRKRRAAPEAPAGFTIDLTYHLRPPLAGPRRTTARVRAAKDAA